jgi:hypothetical protein
MRVVPEAASKRLQIDGGDPTLLTALDIEADPLALAQIGHPGTLDGGNVDEDILGAPFRLNEAISLLGAEPFHRAVRHGVLRTELRSARIVAPPIAFMYAGDESGARRAERRKGSRITKSSAPA